MAIHYNRTNEYLPSIVAGLNVKKGDKIIAIGGSGDQALALIEWADRVLAVDRSIVQVSFIETAVESIRRGDYSRFTDNRQANLPGDHLPQCGLSIWVNLEGSSGGEYFSQERLDRIKSNLDRLEIKKRDILKAIAQRGRGFNKFYLSNALNYSPIYNDIPGALELISRSIPVGSLVYLADNLPAERYAGACGFSVDRELTKKAEEDKNWNPLVLRKIA